MTDTRTASDPLAVYIHWPFCRSLCPYCDFNSHVADRIDHRRWREALLRELAHYAERAGRRAVTSIFFGGGTPSLMEPDTAGALISAVKQHFDCAADIEITLEANPTSVEAGRLAAFAAAGVNRVSLGIQALDDAMLKFLGRTHNKGEAVAAIETAAKIFPRYSFDLIYTRPEQTVDAWRAEMEEGLALAGEHLSLYQLTIEQGTPFYLAWARGDLALPDEDMAAALFEVTQDRLADAGLPAYEISNHARPGAECRHNLTYWRYGDYLGIGPGAHGRLAQGGALRATRQHRAPDIWLQRVEESGHATQTDTPLDNDTIRAEMVMMGLRLAEGIDAARFAARTGASLADTFPDDVCAPLVAGGFLERDTAGMRATKAGRQRLDAVLSALLNS